MRIADPAVMLSDAAGLVALGRIAEAQPILDGLLASQPRDKRLLFDAAVLAERAGCDALAIAAYGRLLKLDRRFVPAWMNLGSLHLRADAVDAARNCFATAARLAPALSDAPLGLGYAHMRAGRLREAIAAFSRAVALEPARAQALANLGAAQLKAGDFVAALDALRRAVALQPDDPDLACSLGITELQVGNVRPAADLLDGVLRHSPRHARALGARAAAAVRLKEADVAAALLDADALLLRHDIAPAAADAGAFNTALAAAVERHPSLARDRAGKTTRNGGQTGNLAEDPDPMLRRLVAEVEGRIAAYLAELGGGTSPWRLNIWATVLDRDGHQAIHNHPGGLASGVYYVRLPDQPADSDAGCIEFGRPPPEFDAAADEFARVVRPEEGAMLLFPSHLWHRTIPSASATPRISIAFDAVALA